LPRHGDRVLQTGARPAKLAVSRRVMLGGVGLLVAVAIGAAIWVGAFWVGALGHTADTMDPAIIVSLENQGITLAAPPTTSVPIGKEQAKAIAVRQFPNDRPVSAAILARVVVQKNARYNCTCWVVSWQERTGLPPRGGLPGAKASASDGQAQSWLFYRVTFIDAQSGNYEFAVESYVPYQPSPK
jgi:hypothetical protein